MAKESWYKQVEALAKRIEDRKEHQYAGARLEDVPDLKKIDEIISTSFEASKEDYNRLFFTFLFLAEKYTSLGRMSIAAKYRFDALRTADTLNHIHQYTQDIVKHLKDTFSNLLRDRNYYVDDDCVDCLELMKHIGLLDKEVVDSIYQDRMKSRRSLKHDPVEMSKEYLAVIDEVEKKVQANKKHDGMGSCFETWGLKKQYLAEKGIDWKTPFELNPRVMFD